VTARKLAGFVHVNGTVYGPDDEVPAEVSEQITNPKAWAEPAPKVASKPAAKPQSKN
jgi:hypothetical protein